MSQLQDSLHDMGKEKEATTLSVAQPQPEPTKSATASPRSQTLVSPSPKQQDYFNVDGHCAAGFEKMRKAFRSNFSKGTEEAGAAFAVYYKGKLVVDLWGGWADKSCRRAWRRDTLTTIFSCTKSISAICLAMLHEQQPGTFDYNDLVVKHWPEFGQNGKEQISIQHLLSHRAGLVAFDKKLTLDDIQHPDKMAELVEAMKPTHPVGARCAYQPLTYGWIIDQLFRRLDKRRRSIGQFFRENIQQQHDVDAYLGVANGVCYRVARLQNFSRSLAIREGASSPGLLPIAIKFYEPGGHFRRAMKDFSAFGADFTMFNNPDLRHVEIPSVNGLATARSLAQIHWLFASGKLVSRKTLEAVRTPLFPDAMDATIGDEQSHGHGWKYERNKQGDWLLGHTGVGGQNVRIDWERELVFCYLTNGMKPGVGRHVSSYRRLTAALDKCVKQIEKDRLAVKEQGGNGKK